MNDLEEMTSHKTKSSRKESGKDAAPLYDLDELRESGDLDTLRRELMKREQKLL